MMERGAEEDKTKELISRYAWRGFSVISYCPSCLTPLLTTREMKLIGEAWMLGNPEKVIETFNRIPGVAGFGIYIPGNEEYAQLLEHRYVIHPICYACSLHVGEPEYERKTEENIVVARRFIAIIKG